MYVHEVLGPESHAPYLHNTDLSCVVLFKFSGFGACSISCIQPRRERTSSHCFSRLISYVSRLTISYSSFLGSRAKLIIEIHMQHVFCEGSRYQQACSLKKDWHASTVLSSQRSVMQRKESEYEQRGIDRGYAFFAHPLKYSHRNQIITILVSQ